jgi:hypothetical protein
MNYIVSQILGLIILGIIIVCLGWELHHLGEWTRILSEDPAGALRRHAYDYVTWMFGDMFGWTLGE